MAKQVVDTLTDQLAGLVVVQGVVAIVFGILTLFWPGLTMSLLLIMVGVFFLVLAVIGMIVGLASIHHERFWWVEVLFSVVAIGVAVYLLRNPLVGASVILTLIGTVFVVRGVFDVMLGFFDERSNQVRWLQVIAGTLGVVAGILVFNQPIASGVAMAWILGLYAVLYGVMAIAISLVVRAEVEANR